MFYSEMILAKKGPLANVWLAANWERRLTRGQVLQTDLAATVADLVSGEHPPMALRLQGQLLLGVSKIYGRQAKYLLEDCGEALGRLQEHHATGTAKADASAVANASKKPQDRSALVELAQLKRSAVVPLDRIPEFSVEEFLRAVPAKPAPSTPQKRSFDDEDSMSPDGPELGLGVLSPQANAELMQALNLSPFPQGFVLSPPEVEVGRRNSDLPGERSSLAPLPVSPLRSPVDEFPQDEWPGIAAQDGAMEGNGAVDYKTALEEDNGGALIGSEAVSDSGLLAPALLISPPPTKSAKRARRARNGALGRGRDCAVQFDEETELDSSVLNQSLPTPIAKRSNQQAKKTNLLSLLSRPMEGDEAFADLFQDIALSSPLAPKTTDRLMASPSPQLLEGEVADAFGGEPVDNDLPHDDNQIVPEPMVTLTTAAFENSAGINLASLLFTQRTVQLKALLSSNGSGRCQAANVFFQLLALGHSTAIEQSMAFGEITVTAL